MQDGDQTPASESAEDRFRRWENEDPYPHIPPALLNSADIEDYIKTTGMVDLYDPGLMKSSSYEARIGEYAYYWDERGEREDVNLTETSSVELKPNSLVFFETKETFRLPPYMAIRFNLRITNVHRGLLLGTGPLVDPGFRGKLLIPIHNLTNNSYFFKGNERFIWIEFTKISGNRTWNSRIATAAQQSGIYRPFPKDKKDRTPAQYFENANNGNSIRNATPAVLVEVQQRADKAEAQANSAAQSASAADRTVRNYGKIFTIGAAGAILAVAVSIVPIITDSTSLSKDVAKTISDFQTKYRDHLTRENISQAQVDALGAKLADIKLGLEAKLADIKREDLAHVEISRQQTQLDDLKKQISALRTEIDRYKALLMRPNVPKANQK